MNAGIARVLLWLASVACGVGLVSVAHAQTLVVNGTTTTLSGLQRYDHICVINGGVINVMPYAGGSKITQGNVELLAGSVYVDSTSRIVARGAGYVTPRCSAGAGPTATAGGRGGCDVADSGGGGAHFGRGGRGTIDAPTEFPLHYEDACGYTWDPNGTDPAGQGGNTVGVCSGYADCGTLIATPPCPNTAGSRLCRQGPSGAGLPFWHSIYASEFGAAGGDKGCRDHDGRTLTTGGSGGGRVVIAGLSHLTTVATSTCGVLLPEGRVRIDGDIDVSGKRGCGIENDSGGGGAGGTVLIVGEQVDIGAQVVIEASGALGGDTRSAAVGQPNYLDCPGGQSSGTCDDCGGGGGGGIINVLSVTSNINPSAVFNVSGAAGGTCAICAGEAGGSAGELQIDGAYVGEFCDGFDNDFDGQFDENLGTQSCGLGNCQDDIAACAGGEPVSCTPMVSADPTCTEDAAGARPRIAVILDTSASMLLSLDGYPTFGDGSVDQPGIDVDSDGQPNDSRLFLARESLAQVMSAYPEIDFALARYHQDQALLRNCQTASWFECQNLAASYDQPAGNTGTHICDVDIGPSTTVAVNQQPQTPEECINYAGSCGPPRRGADVLGGFGMPVRDMVRWLDGRETDFRAIATPGNVCGHLSGGDCEVRGSGPTPLAGSLQAIEDYMVPIRTTDGAIMCRSYSVILVTDGAESCNGDPAAEAMVLHDTFDIDVYVVAVSVLEEEEDSLNAIALAGGTTEATFVTAPEDLVPALTSIISGSIRFETCNMEDDDCDGEVDEGLTRYCDKQNGIDDATLCEEPDEICDGIDDDCDGLTDEGALNVCGACGAVPDETCDGFDNDCDGRTDESTDGGACGEDEGQCEEGSLRCVGGDLECRGEVGPEPEACDCEDDDCDGSIDEDPDGSVCESSICLGCVCVLRCEANEEFEPTCAPGLATEIQENGECLCVEDSCDPDACADSTLEREGSAACAPDDPGLVACSCRGGQCTAPCDGVTCAMDQVCNPRNGKCVEDSCRGLGCSEGELCDALTGGCVSDPCAMAMCTAEQVCRGGLCEQSCADVQCKAGQLCESGRCRTNACASVICENDQFCDPGLGRCMTDPCEDVTCAEGLVCDPGAGECERDACWDVHCPGKQRCVAGQCHMPSGGNGSAGTGTAGDGSDENKRVLATGGGGCACRVAAPASTKAPRGAALLFGALLGVLWMRLGRRRPLRGRIASLAVFALLLVGCKVSPFCLDCTPQAGAGGAAGSNAGSGGTSSSDDGGIAGDGGAAGDGGNVDSGDSDASACADGPRAELCNGEDDDCDFRVDEEVTSDDNDCDQLGVCAGTQPVCIGAQFECRYTSEREDDETRCDGEDNDCDGRVDESFTELGDECELGVGACRTQGELVCDGSGTGLRCELGAMPEPSDEICDAIDNDCDGLTDEPRGDPGSHESFVLDDAIQVSTNLWVYTYEASRPDATDDDQGVNAGRSCSRPDVLPWTSVPYAAAKAACEAAGARLCTASEWLEACEGASARTYPYGNSYDGDSCNGADHDISASAGIQNGLLPTASIDACISQDGLYDMSGNAKEWTNDPQSGSGATTIYVVRGGNYESPELGLRCSELLSQAIATTALPSLGFRCCSDDAP